MLAVNCAALSRGLLESELFGHEKGAFTGADRLRRGRFELADDGTLLLDEISEMDLNLQAKLLRVLQEKTFERVGSSITRRANVRVIVTTNRDLKVWVAQRRFRADLYYRLNVVPITVPPLRQRVADIEPLAEYFNFQVAQREGRSAKRLEESALEALRRYSWPGNVRELQNIVERANVLAEGPVIRGSSLSPWLDGSLAPEAGETAAAPLADGRLMEEMEKRLIYQTLDRFGGHRARTLGMKLKNYRQVELAMMPGA
jgi:transcriptional regulator with GAF, ATPase, and Fis domain